MQVISHQKRLSYAAAHVGKGTEAFAKVGDVAAAPLKVVASGLHAGRRALDDRYVLRAAIADTQHALQGRRERYRVHNTEVLSCHPLPLRPCTSAPRHHGTPPHRSARLPLDRLARTIVRKFSIVGCEVMRVCG